MPSKLSVTYKTISSSAPMQMCNHAIGICVGAASSSSRMRACIGGVEHESTVPWDPPLSLIFASMIGELLESA
jgi:hypothetical protein